MYRDTQDTTPNATRSALLDSLLLLLISVFLFSPQHLSAKSTSNEEQVKVQIESLDEIASAIGTLQGTAAGIVIKQEYCIPGTGYPLKAPVYEAIQEHAAQLNSLQEKFVKLRFTVNKMRIQPFFQNWVPENIDKRMIAVEKSIHTVRSILHDKKSALDSARVKDCRAKAPVVKYEPLTLPDIPDYLCTKKEKQNLVTKASDTVETARRNVLKAQSTADWYAKAPKGESPEAAASYNKLFEKALEVYNGHKKIWEKAKALLKAAKKLKVVKCDKNGVMISTPPLERTALQIPELLRPMTGVCEPCREEQEAYNREVEKLSEIRTRIADIVRLHGGSFGYVLPGVAAEYRLLTKEWEAKHGLAVELRYALDQCIRSRCAAEPETPVGAIHSETPVSVEENATGDSSGMLEGIHPGDLDGCGVGYWKSKEDMIKAMRSPKGIRGLGWELMGIPKPCPKLGKGKIVQLQTICERFTDGDYMTLSPDGIPLCWSKHAAPPATAGAYMTHWGIRGLTLSSICMSEHFDEKPTIAQMQELVPIIRYNTGEMHVECFYMKRSAYEEVMGE